MRTDILTNSGKYFDFTNPEASSMNIYDIAHGLANTCRFAGQCHSFYSVAQHSVFVSELVAPEHAFQALLHDAAEAYMGDMTAPLKAMLPEYKVIENRVQSAIYVAFGLNPVPHESIKRADILMLATEQAQLMPPHDDEWALIAGITPLTRKITPQDPIEAHFEFLNRFQELYAKHTARPKNI